MLNVEITENATSQAIKYQIKKKFDKQVGFLKVDPHHNSLKYQPLVETRKDIYKFRVDLHYWGLVIKIGSNSLKVFNVIKHP